MTAMSGRRGPKLAAPACTEVFLKRRARDLGDRAAASVCFMAKPRVQIVWELHGRSSHVCQHIASDPRCRKDRTRRRVRVGLARVRFE